MTVELAFSLTLAFTVALLSGVVATGKRAARRAHLSLVAATLTALACTIVLALRLGHLYDLKAAGWITPVHLTLARVCAVAYLLPLTTGLLTLRRPTVRPLHAKAAYLVVLLTVLSAVTGTWMMLRAERRVPAPSEASAPSSPSSPSSMRGELPHEPGHEHEARVGE